MKIDLLSIFTLSSLYLGILTSFKGSNILKPVVGRFFLNAIIMSSMFLSELTIRILLILLLYLVSYSLRACLSCIANRLTMVSAS